MSDLDGRLTFLAGCHPTLNGPAQALIREAAARIREIEAATKALEARHRKQVEVLTTELAAIEAATIERCAQSIEGWTTDECGMICASDAAEGVRALKPAGTVAEQAREQNSERAVSG
jgi:hypothetical protein